MKSRRRVNSTVIPRRFEHMGANVVWTCRRSGQHRARQQGGTLTVWEAWSRALPDVEWLGAFTRGRGITNRCTGAESARMTFARLGRRSQLAAARWTPRYAPALLKTWQRAMLELVVAMASIARDETRQRLYNAGMWSRALHGVEWFGALHSGGA